MWIFMNLRNSLYPLGFCGVLAMLVACSNSPPSNHIIVRGITLTNKTGTVAAGSTVTIPAIGVGDDAGEILVEGVNRIGVFELQSVSGAQFGTSVVSGNSIVYTANSADALKTEVLTFQVVSRFSGSEFVLTESSTATILITANPNSAPNAKDDTYEEAGQTQLFVSPFAATDIDVLRNDSNLNSPTVAIVTAPAQGTAEVLANGRVRYSFTNFQTASRTDEFTYRVTNADSQSDTATVKVKAEDTGRVFITNNSNHPVTIRANGRVKTVQPGERGSFLDFLISKSSSGQIVATEFQAYDYQLDQPVPGFENRQSVSTTINVSPFRPPGLVFSTNPEPRLVEQAGGVR
jgi:Bacterial Ig domain